MKRFLYNNLFDYMVNWSLYAKHHAISLWWHFFSLAQTLMAIVRALLNFKTSLRRRYFSFRSPRAGQRRYRMLTTTWASILMNKMFLFMFHTSTRITNRHSRGMGEGYWLVNRQAHSFMWSHFFLCPESIDFIFLVSLPRPGPPSFFFCWSGQRSAPIIYSIYIFLF